MTVGQLRRDRSRQAGGGMVDVGGRLVERLLCLLGPPQIVEHQAPVDQGLHILGIELQRAFQLTQRALRLPQQREGHAEQMMDVGKGASRVHYRLEQVNRAVVVLYHESLPGPRQQELSLPGHTPPGTSVRSG
jgi:hypothetical protein